MTHLGVGYVGLWDLRELWSRGRRYFEQQIVEAVSTLVKQLFR